MMLPGCRNARRTWHLVRVSFICFPIYFPVVSQLLSFIPGGTLDWIFGLCESPCILAEGVGAFPWDPRRCTAQVVGRALSYLHGVEATLGTAPLDTPKRGKGNSVAIESGAESRQGLWGCWKIRASLGCRWK